MMSPTEMVRSALARGQRGWRLHGAILAIAAILLLGTGVAVASVAPGSAPKTIHGCVNRTTSVLTVRTGGHCPAGTTAISWNEAGPPGATGSTGARGLHGMPGPAGTNGTNGTDGTNGTNGTDGSSVRTSAGVPTGSCTTGDTDIDLANGEVYSCESSAWTDTTQSIKWSAAANTTTVVTKSGANGTTATANCPSGDVAIGGGASANGLTPVAASYPSYSGGKIATGTAATAWTVLYTLPVGNSFTVSAYVICSS